MNKVIIRNGEIYRLDYPDILVWDKDSDDWLCCSPISSLDPSEQDEMRMVMRCLDYPNVQVIKDVVWNQPYKNSSYIEHTELSYKDYLICIFPVKKNFGCRIWDQDGDIRWEEVNSVKEPYQLLEQAKQLINYLESIK